MNVPAIRRSTSGINVAIGLTIGALFAAAAALALRPDGAEVSYARTHAPDAERPALPLISPVQTIAPPVAPPPSPVLAAPPTWRAELTRVDRERGRAAARAMLLHAMRTPGTVAPDVLTEASYALGIPEALVGAAEAGAIPLLDDARALDLARRAERGDLALIARIDRVAAGDWRRGDPWLALRLAEARGDAAAARRAAAMLPAKARDGAEERVAERFGGRPALAALLLRRAAQRPATRWAVAERLQGIGMKAEAIAVLKGLAADSPIEDRASARLLALWGPRPPADALDWLVARAARATDAAQHLGWLTAYARRVRPESALPVLAADRAADTTGVLLLRLATAADADDAAAGNAALRRLLDGRALTGGDLAAITAATPAAADARLRLTLARRRVEAGRALPRDRFDLGYAALFDRDPVSARRWLGEHLAANPDDAAAMVTMADAARLSGDRRDERRWIDRAVATGTGDSAGRAALLARAGRTDDALAMVTRLRAAAPRDRALIATEARLLIAAGRPGRAQALYRP